jgi:hypothetical protein
VKSKTYLVTGKRQYRWHKPGTVFEARLDPDAEQRAIERGSIRVIDSVQPELENGSYALPPEDWPQAGADEGTTRDASVSRAMS